MSDGPYTLLAMAPSGEASIIKDGDARIWMTSIYAPNQPVDEEAVGGLIIKSGLVAVDQGFDTWDELVEYRRMASTSTSPRFPEYPDYTPSDVRAAIRDTQTAEDPEEVDTARDMLLHILAQAEVLDRQLRSQITTRLQQLADIGRPTTVLATTLVPPMVIDDAMNRYKLPAVA
ncbi:hypothetical protein ACFWE3_11445 [Mycobacteriaceae bacterium NPDC060252]